MRSTAKILLVEDDLSMGFLLSEYLESEGFEVKLCRDGESGLATFQRSNFDLCILDVMMPKMDGFTLAQAIRKQNQEVSILFLTARSLKDDKLKGFELGAEDYVCKPFDEEELLCRIKVLLRRKASENHYPTEVFTLGKYRFDYSKQELSLGTEIWRLTETETEVLRLLCENQNQILRRDDAVEKIYGKRDYFLGRSFDVFISKLRKLLQQDPQIRIENVYKVGFILQLGEHVEEPRI
jgi:DNA-binding response OmpR family regulator